jgi:hypothetical protein
MSKIWRAASALGIIAGLGLTPSVCHAAPTRAESDTPSIVAYGFDGFWTGAQIGLASGYLATGEEYESEEWRKLVFGAGVGALVGVGVGITLGVVDVGGGPPHTGHLILRDVGYGVGLGAIVGTAVGALFLIDDGRPKNLLTGAAVGTVAGAGAGLVFGLIESAATRSEPAASDTVGLDSLRFTLIGSQHSLLPMAGLRARF